MDMHVSRGFVGAGGGRIGRMTGPSPTLRSGEGLVLVVARGQPLVGRVPVGSIDGYLGRTTESRGLRPDDEEREKDDTSTASLQVRARCASVG